MKSTNVLIVGVGGQGVILASDLIAEVAMDAGYDVKKSDSIGMAQRGGSVVSHVRFGDKVHSPLIAQGQADFLLGFEELEAARYANFLSSSGIAIVADFTLIPITVYESKIPYPDWSKTSAILSQFTKKVHRIPIGAVSKELNNPRALNMVMTGYLAGFLDIDETKWHDNIRRKLAPRFVEEGLTAFNKGLAGAGKLK